MLLDSEVFVSNWGLHTHTHTRSLTVRPLKSCRAPIGEGSSSNHHFSGGVLLNFAGVSTVLYLDSGRCFFCNYFSSYKKLLEESGFFVTPENFIEQKHPALSGNGGLFI